MTDDPASPEQSAAPRPPRRPRYRGTHPRHFHEKYKERDPSADPATFAKVLASGKTPAGTHRPIMVREILEVLRVQPGETVVDCTLGYGGHARALLAAVQPAGKLLGLDQDPIELPLTETRLRALGFPPESLEVHRMNFAGLAALLQGTGADAILADLGLSSMQIDDPARGFTFKSDAPLDMRMNPSRGQPAAALLAKSSAAEITRWLAEHSDEPQADLLGPAIAAAKPTTSTQLADLVRRTLAAATRRTKDDEIESAIPRVFQAIRIAVNEEFSALDTFLRRLPECLRPGGRVAILTFHSGEDRRVKHAFRDGTRAGLYSAINDEVLRASREEQRANPRSAPAKLRWAIRAA
jgi:16S rRNA (cytosine1402-N4)-methyltransferase